LLIVFNNTNDRVFCQEAKFVTCHDGKPTKIKKAASTGNLPVEQPTRFELVINMKTAKALGLTAPHALLLRAKSLIQ
jgi:hypothetical protein